MCNQETNSRAINESTDHLAMEYGSDALIYSDDNITEETPSQYVSQSNVTSGKVVSDMFTAKSEGKAFTPDPKETMPTNNEYSERYLELMYGKRYK
jgi:hypothetical protein